MRFITRTPIFSILIVIATIGLSTSCAKEHDLVSDFVVTQPLTATSETIVTSNKLFKDEANKNESPIAITKQSLN